MKRVSQAALALLLINGAAPSLVRAAPRVPVFAGAATSHGQLCEDLERALDCYRRGGYLSREKAAAILDACRDGSFHRTTLRDDWVGYNFYCTSRGRVLARVNGAGGKYHAAKDPAPLRVLVFTTTHGTFLFRESCLNLMVGPPPPERERTRPERPGAPERPEQPERPERPVRPERPERPAVPVQPVVPRIEIPAPRVEVRPQINVPAPQVRVVVPPAPARVSGYFPDVPAREIRSDVVGTVFAFTQSGRDGRGRRVIKRGPVKGHGFKKHGSKDHGYKDDKGSGYKKEYDKDCPEDQDW